MVGNNYFGFYLRADQCLTKKGFRTGPIPFVPQEDINNLSMLVAA